MSCLRHVSYKLKGGSKPDDVAGGKDSVELAAPGASLSAAYPSDRVWSVSDLSVLHELQKPIVVVVPGLYQNTSRYNSNCFTLLLRFFQALQNCSLCFQLCRWLKSKGSSSVIFQNADCQRRFGSPRAHSACCTLVNSLGDDERSALNDWELEIIRVRFFPTHSLAHMCLGLLTQVTATCSVKASLLGMQGEKVHRSRTDIYALFKPLFQGIAKDKPDCLVRMESKVRLHLCC